MSVRNRTTKLRSEHQMGDHSTEAHPDCELCRKKPAKRSEARHPMDILPSGADKRVLPGGCPDPAWHEGEERPRGVDGPPAERAPYVGRDGAPTFESHTTFRDPNVIDRTMPKSRIAFEAGQKLCREGKHSFDGDGICLRCAAHVCRSCGGKARVSMSAIRRLCRAERPRLADPAILPPLACATDEIVLAWAPAPAWHLESTPPGFPTEDVRALIAAANAAPELGGADVGDLIRELDAVAPIAAAKDACDDCDGRGNLSCVKHANATGRSDWSCGDCLAETCEPCGGAGSVPVDRRPTHVEVLDRRPWFVRYSYDSLEPPQAHPHRETLLDPNRLAVVLEVLRDFGAARLSIRRTPKQAFNATAGRCCGPIEPRSDWPLAFVAGETLGALIMPRLP